MSIHKTVVDEFLELRIERNSLESQMRSIDERMRFRVPQMNLRDVACFFPWVQVYTVWGKEDLNVVLLVNKNRLGGCGILLWGTQFTSMFNTLALTFLDQFEIQFMVFDGQPGSPDFTMLRGAGPDEAKKLFENLRRVCSNEGVSYVFLNNAKVLSDTTKIYPGKEFREISDFYMMIACRDGSIIPEFNFINPKNSSAFWSNNG